MYIMYMHVYIHTSIHEHTSMDTHHLGTPERSISIKPAAMLAWTNLCLSLTFSSMSLKLCVSHTRVCVYMCAHARVCVYAYITRWACACIRVYIHEWMRVRVYACIHISVYACIHLSFSVHPCVMATLYTTHKHCTNLCLSLILSSMSLKLRVHTYNCVCVCVFACAFVGE